MKKKPEKEAKRLTSSHKVPSPTGRLTPFFLSAVGGVLFALSLPKVDFFFTAWVCLVPLLFAIENQPPHRSFLFGLVFGLFAYTGIFYWTYTPMYFYGGISLPVSMILVLLFATYISIYSSLFAYLVSWSRLRFSLPLFVTVPVAWTALEFFRAYLLTGFPWGYLGHSQLQWLTFMQVLDITGVYGVTFVIAAVNVALFLIVKRLIGTITTFPFKEAAVAAILVAAVIGYGLFALNREERIFTDPSRIYLSPEPVTVALIQGSIPQNLKWNPSFREETVSLYEEMTRASIEDSPDLVVWPETAMPFFYQDSERFVDRIVHLADENDIHLFFGIPAYEIRGDDSIAFFNRAYLFSPEGDIVGYYDKRHLVPFGEYVPLKKLLFFVDKLTESVGETEPGSITDPMETEFGAVGSLICYEAIFPEISRMFARKNAALLVNITNDAWYGTTSAPYQHFSLARMRAIETRLPLIRVANTGISAVVHPTGDVEMMTPLFRRTISVAYIRPCPRTTFYTRFGDVFAWLVTLCFFTPIFIHWGGIIRKGFSHEEVS
ncbi:MAG: apolipoprotein N-acyltransferase [Deltaproteobacteria bacterium]|nr:apolipoprotein N-acyltransferase [Candidatus Zymogenaceae bacterium]